MSQLNQSQTAELDFLESNWNSLFKIGGTAAITMAIIILIQSFIFFAFPPPKTVIEYFDLFQKNPLIGLLDLDLLLIIDNLLLIFVYLAFYAVLKSINKSLMTAALVLGLLGLSFSLFQGKQLFQCLL
jgi:uncharacterized protein (DUF486 family)